MNCQPGPGDAAVRDLVTVDTSTREVFPDRGGLGGREMWVSPLEAAAPTGKALWSDDVVVRELAAGQTIPAFSTLESRYRRRPPTGMTMACGFSEIPSFSQWRLSVSRGTIRYPSAAAPGHRC